MTLNGFLRRLPELVVDNLTFCRGVYSSEYILKQGSWKLRKIGYNEYSLSRLVNGQFVKTSSWGSGKSCGNISILDLRVTLSGVFVYLGDDTDVE